LPLGIRQEDFLAVNCLSKTQLALINILAVNLIRSSRLVLFSELGFLTSGMVVVVQTGSLSDVCSKETVLRLGSA